MRRLSSLSSLFSRHSPPAPPPVVRRSGIEETVCAPKPGLKRSLNEGGHKPGR
jgi:hypothetical protein